METNKVIAPRQYGNRFFDVMACPVEVLPETFSYHYLYLQPIITQYFIDNKSEIWLLFLIAHSKR